MENAEEIGKGDTVSLMLQLLLLDSLKQDEKLQVVLTLGHMLELSCKYMQVHVSVLHYAISICLNAFIFTTTLFVMPQLYILPKHPDKMVIYPSKHVFIVTVKYFRAVL